LATSNIIEERRNTTQEEMNDMALIKSKSKKTSFNLHVTKLSISRIQIGKTVVNKNSAGLGAQSAAPKLPRSRKLSTMTHSIERAGERILQ
jgi:hypothetical protein